MKVIKFTRPETAGRYPDTSVKEKEVKHTMASNKENRKKLQNFKTEVANSLNVNLKQGYNGDLTSRQAGSIGGEMVKRMIAYAENNMNNSNMQ